MGDYVVSTIANKFRQPIIAQTAGFIEDFDTYLTPGNIGIDIDADGMLSLDSTKFDEAIAEDYMGVLALIGADKTGSSTSNSIRFYDANDYTTAGEYDVQVEFDASGNTTAVRIKLSTESTYRDMDYSDGYATGISTLNDNGDPDYAECGLQLTVPTTGTPSSTTSATVRIKQGFTGKIEDALDRMLKATVGSIIVDQDHIQDQIDLLDDKIEDEEYRLEKREDRLILQFARLEATLAAIQSQMVSAGVLSAIV
jgi:flagellar capping protein FliD